MIYKEDAQDKLHKHRYRPAGHGSIVVGVNAYVYLFMACECGKVKRNIFGVA